jgi:hypothetical protein
MEDMVTLRRKTRLGATYLSGQDRSGLQSNFGVAICGSAQPDRSNTHSRCATLLAIPDPVSASTNGTSFRRARHWSGQTVAIEYASVQIVRTDN